MASSGGGGPAPIPDQNSWKGHPQPEPDIRLLAARYFLSDEDPDRSIDFESHIAEIEEYVAYLDTGIRNGSIACDLDLLRDVKVKVAVHRDWAQSRRDRIPDIGCDKKPFQLSFSSRTSAAQAPARQNPIRATDGLSTQVREDHPPFSVRREDDHSAFLAALKKDSSGDPDEVDIETNLLWTESRAYDWALREPVLIPSWMHPSEGIPRKGVSAADITPWYRRLPAIDPTDIIRARPARGWIPQYLLAREEKINSLMGKTELSGEEMGELEELLHFIEPHELHRLHAESLAFDKDDALGLVTDEEQEYRQQVAEEFAAKQAKWMSTFTDVYFILKSSRPDTLKMEQPGVFYVNHGVMGSGRQTTLAAANDLLAKICVVGYDLENLNPEDLASMEVFLQFSQPAEITNLGRRRAAILRQAKANKGDDLEVDDRKRYDEIYAEERMERNRWINSIASASLEFRYLRPREMPEVPVDPNKPEVLYIPWNISSIPTVQAPVLLELALPPEAQKLQESLTSRLASTTDEDKDIASDLRLYLQVAHPDLRALGTRWLEFQAISEDRLESDQARLKGILDPIFTRKFANWRHGLLDRERMVTVKMPPQGMEDERPGILYCRSSVDEDSDEVGRVIQDLLDLGPNRGVNETRDLQTALINYQYPALRRVHEEYLSTIAHGRPNNPLLVPRKKRWTDMMNRWIRTLEGSLVDIKRPNPSTLPDNDPSTVYYRGTVRPPSYPPMVSDQASWLEEHLSRGWPIERYHLTGDVPPEITKACEKYQKTKRPEDGLLYAFQIDSWRRAYDMVRDSEPGNPEDEAGSVDNPFVDEHRSRVQSSAYNPPFGVGFIRLLPQINSISQEINRLTMKLKRGVLDPDSSAEDNTRLQSLLQQFIPTKIQEEISWLERQTQQIQSGKQRKPGDVEDLDNRRTLMEEKYNRWTQDIIQSGAHIRIQSDEPYTGRQILLNFQVHATGKNADFHVTAPRMGSPPSTAPLEVYRISSDLPNSQNFTLEDKLILRDFERSINSLLNERSQAGFNWEASETLLSKLRMILPPPLQDMERENFAIDKRARETHLPQEEREKFFSSWERWNLSLDYWIKTIPNGRVIIATSDLQDPAKTIPLTVSNASELQHPATPRPKTLPYAVQTMARDLNDSLFGNSGVLSTDDRQKRDSILWQFFHPLGDHVRSQLIAHIRNVYFSGVSDELNLSPEVLALIDSILMRCCTLYGDMLRTLKEVHIEEPVPGTYLLSHASLLEPEDAGIMSDATDYERLATRLLRRFCIDMFSPKRREFLQVAGKISHHIILTPTEESIMFEELSIVAGAGLKELHMASDISVELATEASQPEGLTNNEHSELLEADGLCVWYQWVPHCVPPELRGSIPSMSTMVDVLLESQVHGAPRDVLPMLIDPPSNAEILDLQITLNNLLMHYKKHTATPEMISALDFVLRELMSPSLRLLKSRIELQELGVLGSSVSLINGMGFLEAQRGFQARFEQFKNELCASFGIVLDHFWYSEEVIFAACARWRLWKSLNRNSDGMPKIPITGISLLDDVQQELFETYRSFATWVLDGCPEDVTDDIRLRLILKAIPDIGFAPLQTQIRDTTLAIQAANGSKDPTQGCFLLGIKEELIKSYMRWYSSQQPSTLQALRKKYAAKESNIADFSGKAERRGIQRAAIEIALNFLASNQEQHRPADRFRVVDLSRKHVPLEKEIQISLPLDPARRQIEQDSFEFTKKMLAYNEWKEFDYEVSREKVLEDPSIVLQRDPNILQDVATASIVLDPPINYHGPFVLADTVDAMATASRRQAELSRVALVLQSAYTEFPRPLLEKLLSLVSQGMDATQLSSHILYDEVPLTKQDLELLLEISGESWDETAKDYPDDFSHVYMEFPNADLSRLDEFEADLENIVGIPLWAPQEEANIQAADEFSQITYSPEVRSQHGVTLDRLSLEFQKLKGDTPYTHHDMRLFLVVMKSAGRIHYDDMYGKEQVSRIPHSGHPENKYVTSREDAFARPYIRRNVSDQLEVRYDEQGQVGPPIVQPNKYEHFQRLAFRLGRDTLRVLEILGNPPLNPERALEDQTRAAEITRENMKNVTPEERGQSTDFSTVNLSGITIENLAREICSSAPHLATELGIELPYRNPYIDSPVVDVELDTRQAASLIQLKLLEELSNNFEPKFPVNETVWDFADDRLATETRMVNGRKILLRKQQTKYFSVRRHPICCQTQATKEAISKSGPVIQFEPEPEPVLTDQQQQAKDQQKESAEEAAREPLKKVRHIRGQRPYYPFGETPYQEAYHSQLMEYELRDVEAFYPKPTGFVAGIQSGIKSGLNVLFGRGETVPQVIVEPPEEDPPIPNDPHPLPRIPSGWIPDNISAEEMRLRLIELAKQTPGFPDPAIPEWYHTQEEIAVNNHRAKTARNRALVAVNDAEVARRFGKTKSQVTAVQWATWQADCGIDPRTGLKLSSRNYTAGGLGAHQTIGAQDSIPRVQRAGTQTTGWRRGGRPPSRQISDTPLATEKRAPAATVPVFGTPLIIAGQADEQIRDEERARNEQLRRQVADFDAAEAETQRKRAAALRSSSSGTDVDMDESEDVT